MTHHALSPALAVFLLAPTRPPLVQSLALGAARGHRRLQRHAPGAVS